MAATKMFTRAARLVGCFGIVAASAASAFAAVPGDYNGDGLSDLAVAKVSKSKGITRWSVRLSDGTVQSYDVKLPGDALSPGNFSGGLAQGPAVVFVRDVDQPLEWMIVNPDGTQSKRLFGKPGDTPVQGDYDCDGTVDLATRRPKNSRSRWYIQLSSTGATVNGLSFGRKTDKVFAADGDGDGCDDLFAVRLKRNKIYFYSRKLHSADITTVQWGQGGDIPLEPIDLNGDGAPDYVVVRVVNGENIAFVRYDATNSTIVTLGKSTSVPLAGNFTGQNGLAYFDRKNGAFFIKNADGTESLVNFGSSSSVVIRPDGSVVQPNDSGRLGSTPGSGGGGGDGGGFSCDDDLSNDDGPGGFTNNPDNSRGTMKFVLPGSFTGNTDSVKVGKNGDIFDTFYNASGNEWGNRERYYGTKSLGSYPNDLTGIITTKSGKSFCVKIPNPRQRYD